MANLLESGSDGHPGLDLSKMDTSSWRESPWRALVGGRDGRWEDPDATVLLDASSEAALTVRISRRRPARRPGLGDVAADLRKVTS